MGYMPPCARMRPTGVGLTYRSEATDATTQEERLATLERDVENEQEWRREMLKEMRGGFARLDAKFNWTIGLPIALLIAIIASNWIG